MAERVKHLPENKHIMDKDKEKMNKIVNLDQNVIMALDFFIKNPPPSINIDKYNSPLVVGSGNAYNTGAILFAGKDAILADESNFRPIIESANKKAQNGLPRDVVVISASGGKDSVWETKLAKEYGLKTTLLTTKSQSEAAKIADEVVAFKSIAEPYTYNTSTYMAMMLGATGENPAKIKEEVEKLKTPENIGSYKGYSFVLPDKFVNICPMIAIKQDELFGPHVPIRANSEGHARHAKYVVRTPEELVISIGQNNENYGDPNHRWNIPMPPEANFAEMMALTYYIVGKIQAVKPPYFKENITRYVNEDGPKSYGPDTKPFSVIVPGSES